MANSFSSSVPRSGAIACSLRFSAMRRRYADKSRSENTWRGYRSAWERFNTWCQAAHLSALPVTPQTVAMFIVAEADAGRANATLEHRLAAIRVVHLGAGHSSPHNTLAALAVPGSPYCPVTAWWVWRQAAGITDGPLFRRISSLGTVGDTALSDKTVVRLIKRTARAAGLNETRYSGHSLRRGFLTSAAMNRANVLKMVAHSRHANVNSILAYVDNQQLFDNHAGQRLLQPTVVSEEGSAPEQEDGERGTRSTTV